MRANKTWIDEFELPVGRGPIPHRHAPSVDMIIAASEELLPSWNANPRREEERLSAKSPIPFSLGE